VIQPEPGCIRIVDKHDAAYRHSLADQRCRLPQVVALRQVQRVAIVQQAQPAVGQSGQQHCREAEHRPCAGFASTLPNAYPPQRVDTEQQRYAIQQRVRQNPGPRPGKVQWLSADSAQQRDRPQMFDRVKAGQPVG
jgi:hypothetical protein